MQELVYRINVETPLGEEEAFIHFDSIKQFSSGKIRTRHGEATIEDFNATRDTINFKVLTGVPFNCCLVFLVNLIDSNINGHILIEDFLKCKFSGEKING